MIKFFSIVFLISALTPIALGAINESEAKSIALKQVTGEVLEVEREFENGREIISVEIVKDGKTFEVHIDPSDGKVLKIEE